MVNGKSGKKQTADRRQPNGNQPIALDANTPVKLFSKETLSSQRAVNNIDPI